MILELTLHLPIDMIKEIKQYTEIKKRIFLEELHEFLIIFKGNIKETKKRIIYHKYINNNLHYFPKDDIICRYYLRNRVRLAKEIIQSMH